MRVRTALATPRRAEAVKELFEFVKERRVTFVVGTGHPYADLEKVANANGYDLWLPSEGEPKLWVALRADLVSDADVEESLEHVRFTTTKEGLGPISVGALLESQLDDSEAVVFFLGDNVLSATNHDGRVSPSAYNYGFETPTLSYTEQVFSVTPLTS